MSACPSDDVFGQLVESALPPPEAASVQAHIDGCERCQALYAAVARAVADSEGFAGGERVGKYRVEERVGAGGMGVVYRAWDETLRRKVALKLLAPGLADDPQARARMEREARACAALNHPHVGGVHEIGSHQGRVFLVMPLFEGGTLKDRLQRGPLPLDEALPLLRQLAGALAAAHRAGVFHRDVKPGNVMLTSSGARLVDFGLAKLTSVTATLSSEGQLLGTPAYMAPEQFEGESDARADVWSFGAVAYEMLAGRPPFSGATLPSLAAAVRLQEPAPLAKTTPRDLAAVIAKCLAKEPERRYASAVELDEDLSRLARNLPTVARLPGAAARLGRLGRRWRAALTVGAIGVVAVAVVALAMHASTADRLRRAQALIRKAVELRSSMREAHLLPLHDTRPERAAVRADIETLEAKDVAGHYAIGSGWAALGDWKRALAELEAAWAAGDRDPELTFLLGYAGSRRYHDELEEARRLPPVQRPPREKELQRTLRDPALARLREAATPESRELVEALIAFDEGDYQKSLAAAQHAFAAAPRRYEAGAVAAEAEASLAAKLWKEGQRDEAVRWVERAAASYDKVLEVARSDDALYAEAAAARYQTLGLYAERGEVGDAMMRALIELWKKAQQANPDDPALQVGEAQAEGSWGSMLAANGGEWESHVRAAIRLCETVLAKHPDEARAWIIEGVAWSNVADYTTHDRTAAAEKAVQALERAVALRPDLESHFMAATVQATLAREQMVRAVDATASWSAAQREGELVLALDPDHQPEHYNLGDVLAMAADERERRGGDPVPLRDGAIAHLQRAAELDRSDAMPGKRLAEVLAQRGLYRLRHHAAGAAADIAEARAQLEATTRANPNRVELWRTRAQVSEMEAALALAEGRDARPALKQARAAADALIAGWAQQADESCYNERAEVGLWELRAARGNLDAIARGPLEDTRRSLQLGPDHADAAVLQARLYLLSGHAAEGLRALDAAARLAAPLPSVSALRVRLLELAGEKEAAATLRAAVPAELFAAVD